MPKIQLSAPQATKLVSRWASRTKKVDVHGSALTRADLLSKLRDLTISEGNTPSIEDLEVLAVGTQNVCSDLWMAEVSGEASNYSAQLKAEFQELLPPESPDCTLEDIADTLTDFSQWLYDQRMARSSTHLRPVPYTFRRGITLFDSLSNMSGVRDGISKNFPDLFNIAMSKKDTPDQWTFLEAATVIISLLKAHHFFADPIPRGVDSSRVEEARSRYISVLCQHRAMTPAFLAEIFRSTVRCWEHDPRFRDLICQFKLESFPTEYMTGPQQLSGATPASDSAHLLGDGAWKQRATSVCANDVSRNPIASELDAPYELDDWPDQGASRPFTTPMIDTDQTGEETLPWPEGLRQMLLAHCPFGETLVSGWWPDEPSCS